MATKAILLFSIWIFITLDRSFGLEASWSNPVAACIWAPKVKMATDVTLEECREKCDSTTTFDCRSVEFVESGIFAGTCWMSNLTSADTSDFRSPCIDGVFSSILFSEKIEDSINSSGTSSAGPIENSTNNSGTGETDWTCAFCAQTSSALISHSTSPSSLDDEITLLLANMCPRHPDPASCTTSLPIFWASYGKLLWSGFWSLVCLDQNCPVFLTEFWTTVVGRSLSSPPSCQSCQARINSLLEFLDGPIALNKFLEGLHEFCDSQEDVEECIEIGKWLIPGATNLFKIQHRDWIAEICQQKLNCKKDDFEL